MCHKVTCKQCGKPTWSGCGMHIEQALAGIPVKDRCAGHESAGGGNWLSKLFGKG